MREKLLFKLHNRKRRGFSLVEMAVVIALIGVILAISIAATNFSTENQRSENIRQTLTAVYEELRVYDLDEDHKSDKVKSLYIVYYEDVTEDPTYYIYIDSSGSASKYIKPYTSGLFSGTAVLGVGAPASPTFFEPINTSTVNNAEISASLAERGIAVFTV